MGALTGVTQRVAIGLEALEGQFALRFGLRSDSVDAAFFGMHDGVDPLGE